MLFTQTVTPATLELLKKLMSIPELEKFVLVGGTNLSLQLGHRISVDIDLFCNEPFNSIAVQQAIHQHFSDSIKLDEMKQSLWYMIDGVKTDIILHQYPYLNPVQEEEGIKFLSIPDIIPLKLGAVAGRGAKKDFWDIAELLNNYSLKEMLGFYQAKYSSGDIGFILRSLLYFDDAEMQPDPLSLKNIAWQNVKKQIEGSVKAYASDSIS